MLKSCLGHTEQEEQEAYAYAPAELDNSLLEAVLKYVTTLSF